MPEKSDIKPILANRYQVLEILGTGGMSVVYHAKDLMLEREVAIKLLRQRFSRDPYFRERFREEAKAAANLSHPNIVTVHDFGLDDNRFFIIMEYVPGTDLKAIIKQTGQFPYDLALSLMTQACFGIGYAHRAGLVHCDVKPQNMLITPEYRLKVTDFGIARLLATIHPDEQHEIIWGSPLYFAPEQAAGEAPSPASDVYSLGIILYELITGRVPFNSDDPLELVRLHRDVPPIPPSHFRPDIPVPLEKLILKVLSKKPADRYHNADQLGRILQVLHNNLNQIIETSFSKTPVKEPARVQPIPPPPPPKPTQTPDPVSTLQFQTAPESEEDESDSSSIFDIDWISIAIGLVATAAVSGLIPFWIYVWYTLTISGS